MWRQRYLDLKMDVAQSVTEQCVSIGKTARLKNYLRNHVLTPQTSYCAFFLKTLLYSIIVSVQICTKKTP